MKRSRKWQIPNKTIPRQKDRDDKLEEELVDDHVEEGLEKVLPNERRKEEDLMKDLVEPGRPPIFGCEIRQQRRRFY